MWETRVRSLGQEDPVEKEMAIHSSTLAWRIPWKEEPGRLQSMGSQRVGHDLATSLSVQFSSVQSLSRVQLFATLWTVAYQAPPSMGFSRSEYWSGLPFPSPGDLPDPKIEPGSPALQVDSLLPEPVGKSKNTRVGSLSLLQGNFLTQESNWGLLHYKQILYQLSYLASPRRWPLPSLLSSVALSTDQYSLCSTC